MKYQFSVKTKDNENCIFTGSVKAMKSDISTEQGAVKTVKSDISMKYRTSDISLIIYRFSLYIALDGYSKTVSKAYKSKNLPLMAI